MNIIRLYDDDHDDNDNDYYSTTTSRSPTRNRTVSGDDTPAGPSYNNHIMISYHAVIEIEIRIGIGNGWH